MKKTRIVIWILVALLFIISLSFTVYFIFLNFNNKNEKRIEVSNVSVYETNGQAGNVGDFIYSNSMFTFSSMLIAPSDSITYKVRFVNNSSNNIIIKGFENSRPESNSILLDISNLKAGKVIYAGDAIDFYVKVTYDNNSATNAIIYTNMTVKIDYDEM